MTEKNIFVYQPFLSIIISDFRCFYVKTATSSWEMPLSLSQQRSSKNWNPAKSLPFWKFGRRHNPLPLFRRKKEGVHSVILQQLKYYIFDLSKSFIFV